MKALMVLALLLGSQAYALDGRPVKYIASCEIDLNGDSKTDKVFHFEGHSGDRELVALITTKKGYDAYVVSKGLNTKYLSCLMGPEVKETTAGDRKGRVMKTTGAYLELKTPESAAVAFLWKDGKFVELWTSD